MRIGLTARGSTMDDIVEHACWAEESGITSVWFSSAHTGDPVVAMALAGRATSRIEIGTAVLQTYPCHPLLQANRASSVVAAMKRTGFTLGIGPSHEPLIRNVFGLSYDHPGRSTEEYVYILTRLLQGETVDFDGVDWSTHAAIGAPVEHQVPVLVSALSPRLLRLAGGVADGTITYMAPPNVIESRVVPQIRAAAAQAGRAVPRVVAGLPVAVHEDADEARAAYMAGPGVYAAMPNYQRVLAAGGYETAAQVAIVGDEATVTKQLQSVIDAGADDIWAGIFPVGDEPTDSLRRTTDLLSSLTG
ncbi:MAG: TIGR03564 family F420-dependent LLM class oxidoreductase [Acidimicrobiales bacterium]